MWWVEWWYGTSSGKSPWFFEAPLPLSLSSIYDAPAINVLRCNTQQTSPNVISGSPCIWVLRAGHHLLSAAWRVGLPCTLPSSQKMSTVREPSDFERTDGMSYRLVLHWRRRVARQRQRFSPFPLQATKSPFYPPYQHQLLPSQSWLKAVLAKSGRLMSTFAGYYHNSPIHFAPRTTLATDLILNTHIWKF